MAKPNKFSVDEILKQTDSNNQQELDNENNFEINQNLPNNYSFHFMKVYQKLVESQLAKQSMCLHPKQISNY